MKHTRVNSPILAVTLSAILVLSVAYYWPIQEAYHPLNVDWNGCSQIANLTQNTTMLFSYDQQLPNTTSLLAIIGPSTEFTRDESFKIGRFLETGGVVLLADDFGTGNSLLDALNVSARFSKRALADLAFYSKDNTFPLITNFSPSPVSNNLTTIVLNRPSYIQAENSSQVNIIGVSSLFSFIDFSGVGRLSANETLDSYPILVNVKLGRGLLLLVADPSMFINDVVGLYDNMRLFQNALTVGGGSVIFDTAHLARAPLTDWRIMLRGGLDSLRLGKESIYIPWIVVMILVLSFSFQLLRLARSRKVAK